MVDGSVEKLRDARDKIAEVFEAEVQDDIYDNGLLDNMTGAIKHVEEAVRTLKNRGS